MRESGYARSVAGAWPRVGMPQALEVERLIPADVPEPHDGVWLRGGNQATGAIPSRDGREVDAHVEVDDHLLGDAMGSRQLGVIPSTLSLPLRHVVQCTSQLRVRLVLGWPRPSLRLDGLEVPHLVLQRLRTCLPILT